MGHRTFDRAQEVTTSVGADSLILAGATARMFSFSDAGAQSGDTFWGLIEHATESEVEVTLCTFASGGSGSISRAATPLASTTGAKIDFSPGTKVISNVAPGSTANIEPVKACAILAGVLEFDLRYGGIFRVPINADITEIDILHTTAGFAQYFIVEFTGNGTAYTQVWPWTWLTGTPVLSSANGKRDRALVWSDNGTDFFAAMMHQYY